MIRALPLVGGLLSLIACTKHSLPVTNQADTALVTVPARPPAAIDFTIGGREYFFFQKIGYDVYDQCIEIDASDGDGGIFHIFIPDYYGGDTATTTSGSLIYAKSGIDYFVYSCNNMLNATAVFKNDTLSGTFYGILQYDRTYSYYPPVQGRFVNVHTPW